MTIREDIGAACALPVRGPRLFWLDVMKGFSMLWIVVFHFFGAYDPGQYPWPIGLSNLFPFARECGGGNVLDTAACMLEGLVAGFFQRGPQAVSIFIVLSGFGLTYSLTKTGHPEGGWKVWYLRRLVRLFPMYWVAHGFALASPLAYRSDPLDWRLAMSLLGNRIYPAETLFYYLVPAWWFFGLLIQLYLIFPVLFRLMQRMGPIWFLVASVVFTVSSRYLLFGVLEVSGNYSQGAFFGGRLWEFSAGMVLAYLYRQHPGAVEDGFFSRGNLVLGIALYAAGVYSYQPNFLCSLTDGLIGMGLFIILGQAMRWLACAMPWVGSALTTVGVYSYGLYLLHQPYVITFGRILSAYCLPVFVMCAAGIMLAITLGAMFVEKQVNRISARILDRPTATPVTP